MPESLQQRATNAVERFLEDEALTGDLTDAQAKPLITWATQEAHDLATKGARSLEEIEAELRLLKSAILAACEGVTEAHTGAALIEATKRILEARREEESQEMIAVLLREEEQRAQLAKLEEPLAPSGPVDEGPGPLEHLAEQVHDAALRALEFVRHLPTHHEHPPKDPNEKA